MLDSARVTAAPDRGLRAHFLRNHQHRWRPNFLHAERTPHRARHVGRSAYRRRATPLWLRGYARSSAPSISSQLFGLMETLRDFKRSSAHRVALAGKRTGPLWQARYFDHILRRVRDFSEKLDYIHRNPVEAGLVAASTDWHWSSVLACVDTNDTHASPRQSAPIPVDPISLPFDANASLWPL